MLKITKLSDYGLLIVAHLLNQSQTGCHLLTAQKISESTLVPLPTVNKILKFLTKGKIVSSVKGKKGGFKLFNSNQAITALDVVEAIDGEISVFECHSVNNSCSLSGNCIIEKGVGSIQRKVKEVLEQTIITSLSSLEK